MSFASGSQKLAAGRSGWRVRLARYLVVAGPGLIVMVADNDAGAVSTYTQAGAQYGTSLLWVLLALLPVAYFVQEMVARLGIATGQGHAAMIYQRFGPWWGRFSLFDLLLLNFLTLVTEFAAVALAAQRLGMPPPIAVPIAAVGLILLVGTGSYRRWERMTLGLCGLNLAWFGLAWQLFFQQSCVADKRLRFADLGSARLDTLIGAVAVVAFAGCMMLVGDALYRAGGSYQDPAQMAVALEHAIGRGGSILILLLMCNAAVIGATAISLSSAWALGEVIGGEVMGRPHTLQAKPAEAPHFYAAYALCVAAAAGVVLIPGTPLQTVIIAVQVIAGVMLPSAIVFLQLLLNDREMLGDRFVNRAWNNWVNWTVIGLLFALSMILAVQVLLPGWFPAP